MSETNPMRADAALCARGLAASRERAQEQISAGLAWCDGSVIKKAAQKVAPDALLEVRGECCPYVSRGGFKLAHALDAFDVDPEALVCLDVGASTGGFTDVLLQRGAKHVYAVDVGSGQLAPVIAADARVTSMENMNARTLTPELFPEPPVLGVMDVSFISIVKILPALHTVLGSGRLISLVKPQFEAGPNAPRKKGVISSAAVHERVLRDLAALAPQCGWRVRAYAASPIAGTQGNIEFLADLIPDDGCTPLPERDAIRALVRQAHADVRRQSG